MYHFLMRGWPLGMHNLPNLDNYWQRLLSRRTCQRPITSICPLAFWAPQLIGLLLKEKRCPLLHHNRLRWQGTRRRPT